MPIRKIENNKITNLLRIFYYAFLGLSSPLPLLILLNFVSDSFGFSLRSLLILVMGSSTCCEFYKTQDFSQRLSQLGML